MFFNVLEAEKSYCLRPGAMGTPKGWWLYANPGPLIPTPLVSGTR